MKEIKMAFFFLRFYIAQYPYLQGLSIAAIGHYRRRLDFISFVFFSRFAIKWTINFVTKMFAQRFSVCGSFNGDLAFGNYYPRSCRIVVMLFAFDYIFASNHDEPMIERATEGDKKKKKKKKKSTTEWIQTAWQVDDYVLFRLVVCFTSRSCHCHCRKLERPIGFLKSVPAPIIVCCNRDILEV